MALAENVPIHQFAPKNTSNKAHHINDFGEMGHYMGEKEFAPKYPYYENLKTKQPSVNQFTNNAFISDNSS